MNIYTSPYGLNYFLVTVNKQESKSPLNSEKFFRFERDGMGIRRRGDLKASTSMRLFLEWTNLKRKAIKGRGQGEEERCT